MSNNKNNRVSLGSSVLILLNGREIKCRIVGSEEANPGQRKISSVCPLGKALIGAAAGEVRTFTVGGAEKTVKILDVN